MTINRRQALLGMTSSVLLPAGCTGVPTRANEVFAHGVASGDPQASSVVLWTRISGARERTDIRWALADDPDMQRVCAEGTGTTDSSRDFTFKVVPDGLEAGRRYYYRFEALGVASPTGRTRTLPSGTVGEFCIAVASCSNYPFGHFNAYEAIADDADIDLVIHLGDYIYEYDIDSYGGAAGKSLGRMHQPAHEIVTLGDYRTRHAQYKSDIGSQAMHAAHPLIATWDDHESTNNPWTGGAQNHQPDEGSWAARRAASLQAYYEWMPVREPEGNRSRAERWAHFRCGDLASIVTLESRHTARAEQIDLSDHQAEMQSPEAAADLYRHVIGNRDRRMLSEKLEAFLSRELAESMRARRRWRIVANQTILANVIAPNVDEPRFAELNAAQDEANVPLLEAMRRNGKLGIGTNMDAWDGYPAARERLYDRCREAGARDLLVITGDTHVFWQNQLFDAAGDRMGVELGTSAVTSPRGSAQLGHATMARFDELVAEQNDSVIWTDGRFRGYLRLTLNPEMARADFITVSGIESPDYVVDTLRTITIVRRNGSLEYA